MGVVDWAGSVRRPEIAPEVWGRGETYTPCKLEPRCDVERAGMGALVVRVNLLMVFNLFYEMKEHNTAGRRGGVSSDVKRIKVVALDTTAAAFWTALGFVPSMSTVEEKQQTAPRQDGGESYVFHMLLLPETRLGLVNKVREKTSTVVGRRRSKRPRHVLARLSQLLPAMRALRL